MIAPTKPAFLSIAIQHTPQYIDRRQQVQAMVRQLQREMPNVPVAVIKDTRREGCWPTYLRALEAATDASHHLVLQDDSGLCRDFLRSVREVIRSRPNDLISLYTNSQAVFKARNRVEFWIEKSTVSGAALIWPRKLIGEFIEWQRVHIADNFPSDDGRVSMWINKTSRRAFATVPSLVQHLGYRFSILGLNGRLKTAAWYIGDNHSPAHIDWSRGLESPVKDRRPIDPECWKYFKE